MRRRYSADRSAENNTISPSNTASRSLSKTLKEPLKDPLPFLKTTFLLQRLPLTAIYPKALKELQYSQSKSILWPILPAPGGNLWIQSENKEAPGSSGNVFHDWIICHDRCFCMAYHLCDPEYDRCAYQPPSNSGSERRAYVVLDAGKDSWKGIFRSN
jgi:hypothetical protein